ncbi:uncharacterized protein LOC123564669 [Mercenaria mercenaria]|uniref:uncharacterized protein LOC123564669 n=1 Tax=Mercenaria mercenaria TaxID=6596 RepID=UPI00234E674E|nr:uncharacterized protein LOC123564669 [Mercenaria mercenaria]XP_045214340.2 uncharacterized protein LOC123564669 [Mercenaria mercenaria]
MTAQCTCAQYTKSTNTFDIKDELSGQSRLLVVFIFIASLSYVYCQPLHLPPERFQCGSSNLTCERWGYTACVRPDGEFYCLPCGHEYLRTLCGTKEEVQGCNLYCTEETVNREKKRLQSDFSLQKKNMNKNFTRKLAEIQSDFFKKLIGQQAKLELSQKDRDLHVNRTKSLAIELDKKGNDAKSLKLTLYLVIGGFALSHVALGVCWGIWCRNCRKRDKTSADSETSEKSNLLFNGESVIELGSEAKIKQQVPVTDIRDNATKTESDNVNKDSKGHETDQRTVEQNDKCGENDCPTKAKFQMVCPTSENGFHKMAIQRQDMDCPSQKQN